MLIIGIDPGISGSICFFQDGKIIDVVEMPTMTEGKKNKKQVNGSQIFNEISDRIKKLETVVANFISTEIEWVALNNANVVKDKQETVIEFLESLEDDDDVQNVFSNANFENN
jgi:transcriptional/translational regulatory protein YebC/TACO1